MLVPIYDHGRSIGAVLTGLAPHGLPCLVVDDGSGEETARVLDAIAERYDWVQVHRRKRNGGRGVAMQTGYRFAASRGFSHVVQLDADGQHAAADVPRFLEALRADPQAMVIGTPCFDASAPRSRLLSRQLSRWLVWLFTLSREIADPLCGFRALPLAPVLEAIEHHPMGDHMEFDPELAVRLFWAGTPVRCVETRVVYPADGLSHFDVVRDTARMAKLYARFSVEMLPRLPRLLARWQGRR